MLKIGHIINRVKAPPTSDLKRAQPVTFEAMRIAKEFAGDGLEIRQFSAVFADEDVNSPAHLENVPHLERSVRDFPGCEGSRKLPMIKDILDRLYRHSDADYLIYTNVDIAPMPYFYTAVADIIRQGSDGFIVNRRTISDNYTSPAEIHRMYAEIGETHPGCDCFVFKRELYPLFKLGNVVVGGEFFGLTLRTNVSVFAETFMHFKDQHLTFHIGDDRVWKTFSEDSRHNLQELEIIYPELLESKDVKSRERLEQLHLHFQRRRNKFWKNYNNES